MAESTDTKVTETKTETKTEAKPKTKDGVEEHVLAEMDARINTADVPVTAVDGLGVERIILNSPADYTEPQVEPDPKEVARLAAVQKRLDNKKQERLDQLTAKPEGSAKDAAAAIKAEGK